MARLYLDDYDGAACYLRTSKSMTAPLIVAIKTDTIRKGDCKCVSP